jgi:MFS family permease
MHSQPQAPPDRGTAPTGGSRGGLARFLFHHEIDEYPSNARRNGYLAVAVLATIVLYYTYYTQTGVTPNILRYYHMSFAFYVGIVVVSNLIGAFASLPASKTDKLGRANVVIYGLLIVGLLVTFGVTNVSSEWGFAVVISAIGLVEGAILVATPALVRDFSPQLGRASAMGFWTVGPVAGSFITSLIANHFLGTFQGWGAHSWASQFWISGLTAIATFVVCLVFLKDLSARLRDQLMVTLHDRALVEARARGLSESEVEDATRHPWRQIVKGDLIGSSIGISVFLLIYYVAAAFFTIYYSVTFKNANGTNFSVSQANGLNEWFWGFDMLALVVVGVLSDVLRVRKPFMLLGTLGGIATLIVFLGYASNAHTAYSTLAATTVVLAVCLSLAYAPWMAGYTETVEAKNPALVGTGLALWGWILRLVVGLSFIFLPLVINTVNPVVDNLPVSEATVPHKSSPPISTFVATHPASVAFATAHKQLLTVLAAHQSVVDAVAANPSAANIAAAQSALGPVYFGQLVKYQSQLKTLVQPYAAQLDYLSAHQSQLETLQRAVNRSPKQWQRWFWVDVGGMVLFLPTILLTRGRWSPRRARQDARMHEQAVADELARLSAGESAGSASA